MTDLDNGGIPIVGHAGLFYQDENGDWWYTEYGSSDKTKGNAQIYNYRVYKTTDELLEYIAEQGYEYEYLNGDYSHAGDYASRYVGTNYGGYHPLNNNCMHYVNNVINYALNRESKFIIQIPTLRLYAFKKAKK